MISNVHDLPSTLSNIEEKFFFSPKRKIIIIITATTYNIEDQ